MRIAVIGPQNTGKSTFVADFLKEFSTYATPTETYRDMVKRKGLAINQKTNEESQRLIRDFLAEQVAEDKTKDILFDRCVLDNYVYTYAQYEKGLIDEAFLRESEKVMYKNLDDLDVLILIPTAVSVPLVNDTLRDTDTVFIDRINCIFLETLFTVAHRSMVKIIAIAGTREQRIAQVHKSLKI